MAFFWLSGIFYMFVKMFQIKENLILYIVFDVLIIAVIILRGLNSRYFIKKSKKLNKNNYKKPSYFLFKKAFIF